MKCNVRSLEDAYAYTTDCLLATVSDLAMKKKANRRGYDRHISIAQTACDFIRDFKVPVEKVSRVYEVLQLPTQSVADWAKRYEPKEGV